MDLAQARSKGMSLPIEAIVIIAVAVLVLVVLVGFFVGGAGKQIGSISASEALSRGCVDLVIRYGCVLDDSGAGADLGKIQIQNYGTLKDACARKGYADPRDCARLECRCQIAE